MKSSILVMVLIMLSRPASALDSYLCVADMATGFSLDKKSKTWHAEQFRTTSKYILKRDGNGAEWSHFGVASSQDLSLRCTDFNQNGFTFCTGTAPEEVTFNEKNLRYQLYWSLGYMEQGLAAFDELNVRFTPYIEIGTCSVL